MRCTWKIKNVKPVRIAGVNRLSRGEIFSLARKPGLWWAFTITVVRLERCFVCPNPRSGCLGCSAVQSRFCVQRVMGGRFGNEDGGNILHIPLLRARVLRGGAHFPLCFPSFVPACFESVDCERVAGCRKAGQRCVEESLVRVSGCCVLLVQSVCGEHHIASDSQRGCVACFR